jgi:hypothetical protein
MVVGWFGFGVVVHKPEQEEGESGDDGGGPGPRVGPASRAALLGAVKGVEWSSMLKVFVC